MSVYKSKEQELYRAVMNALINSPVYLITDGKVYDKQPTDINFDDRGNTIPEITYVMVGESRTAPQYQSNQHVEEIVLTMHLYHRNNNNKALVVDETRGFLSLISYYAQKVEIADRYRLDKTRVELQQVITDLDGETMHGILQIRYTIKHK